MLSQNLLIQYSHPCSILSSATVTLFLGMKGFSQHFPLCPTSVYSITMSGRADWSCYHAKGKESSNLFMVLKCLKVLEHVVMEGLLVKEYRDKGDMKVNGGKHKEQGLFKVLFP